MPIPFNIPASLAVDENTGILPSEGWHDVTLTKREAKLSKKQSPMMVCEFTIDNGIYIGTKIGEWIVFGMSTGDGEATLKKFLNSDDTYGTPEERWKALPTLEDFVNQFPVSKLRAGARIAHVKQINGPEGWVTVPDEKWEEFTGQKNIKVKIIDFRGAANPSAIPQVLEKPIEDDLPFPPNTTAPF